MEDALMELTIAFLVGVMFGAGLAACFAVFVYPKLEQIGNQFADFLQRFFAKLFFWKNK